MTTFHELSFLFLFFSNVIIRINKYINKTYNKPYQDLVLVVMHDVTSRS